MKNKAGKKSSEDLKRDLTKIPLHDPVALQTHLSAWIAANRPLLIAAGAITDGAAHAIAWIVEHIDNIKEFVQVASLPFHTRSESRHLDFDSLTIGSLPVSDALSCEPLLLRAVVAEIIKRHGFDDVWSPSRNLLRDGIYP